MILTSGCAKYRYNKLGLGDIGGIPRVLDAGQCNDSYTWAVVALKLKEIFELNDINDLPIAPIPAPIAASPVDKAAAKYPSPEAEFVAVLAAESANAISGTRPTRKSPATASTFVITAFLIPDFETVFPFFIKITPLTIVANIPNVTNINDTFIISS